MDTNSQFASPIRGPQEKRSQKFLHFKLQPGDEQLMDLLPEQQRALIRASGSYQEIAEQFSIPLGTVRSRLHRARAKLEKLRGTATPNDRPPPVRHQ